MFSYFFFFVFVCLPSGKIKICIFILICCNIRLIFVFTIDVHKMFICKIIQDNEFILRHQCCDLSVFKELNKKFILSMWNLIIIVSHFFFLLKNDFYIWIFTIFDIYYISNYSYFANTKSIKFINTYIKFKFYLIYIVIFTAFLIGLSVRYLHNGFRIGFCAAICHF